MKKDVKVPKNISAEVSQKYQVKDNTFVQVKKDNPKDRIEVEIGDSKSPDFKPQAKIMRWDNEVNFSLRAQEHPSATVETEGEIIKYKTPEYEVHMYDKPEVDEDGGLEFEWVLQAKPSTNVLTATIQTKELNFYYQPPLTQEEIDQGASRPENVVGSYAVYHKTKGGMNRADGMEYKVGKAFHIYRPKVTDANGNETWGELNIGEDLLTVTIDQAWLDNAVYPVVVDPTFGYGSIGGSQLGSGDGSVYSSKFTTPEACTVQSITYYARAASGTPNEKGLIINNTSLTLVTNGVGSATVLSTTAGWNTSNTASNPALSGSTDYFLGQIANSNQVSTYYDTGVALQEGDDFSNNYTTPADIGSWGLTGTRKYSIYATYTASGGAAAPATGFMTTNTFFWGS